MSLMNAVRRTFLGLWVAMLLAGGAVAQGAAVSLGVEDHDTSTPLEITSEELELDQETGTAIFEGDVIVRQGDITMTCERMRVEYAEDPETGRNEIQTIRMFGGVTFVAPDEAAESERAVYSLAEETLIMQENVLVTQGNTALSSNKLTYNLASGEGLMEGNVKTVLQQASN